MKTITATDLSATIVVDNTPPEAFNAIANVSAWWAKKFKGNAKNEGDVFSVNFGQTFVDFKITEAIPGEKVIWLVTDCNLHWINDKKEWKNTEVIWTITEKNGKTQIDLVHKGVTPESECFVSCESGWMHHLKDSLQKLIDEGKGFPE